MGFGGGRMMLGPASSENKGAGSGTGRVRAFSLVIRACWSWCGGVVLAARARGLPGGWPYLLQDVRVCLLEVVEGLEEASLDAGHVLLCEVGVVWVGVSGPGHSSVMRRAATMYGQSCRVVGRGGVGPLRFGGASLCWGRSVTTHTHRSPGILHVRWVHLARQYIALPRPWLLLRIESSVSRDLRSHVPQMWGSSGSSPLAYVSGPGLCGGGA